MPRYLLLLCFVCSWNLSSWAQSLLPPAAHGGNPNKTYNLRNPRAGTVNPPLLYDYERQNPQYRNLLPSRRKCVTVEVEQDWGVAHGAEKESEEDFEKWMQQTQSQTQKSRSTNRINPNEILTIPVVVHVIYSNALENISDDQVRSQIRVLNEDYRRQNADARLTPAQFQRDAVDTGIEFCLAGVDPRGRPTNGIDRISMTGSPFSESYINEFIKPNTIWDPNRYLNIWVCRVAGGILGYAQFPQSSGLTGLPSNPGANKTDGVVISYNVFGTLGTVAPPFDRGRTTTHEIGHWMGLRHIWGDGPCGVDDYCADTPEANEAHFSCPNGGISCNNGRAMVSNFMDYTDDACMNLFTRNQRTRMRTVLENSPRRSSLLRSNVCQSSVAPPKPEFIADVNTGCGPLTVNFRDLSKGNPTAFKWSFPGGRPSTSKEQNPKVVYRKPGIYPVTMVVSNPGGAKQIVRSDYIRVLEEAQPLPLTVDFEPESAYPPAGFQFINAQQDQGWAPTARIGGQGRSNGALTLNNYDNNLLGSSDLLISPVLDFSDATSPSLTFDVAYTAFSPQYSDTFAIFVATGCNEIFRCIYYKGGENLKTAAYKQFPFSPSPEEWRSEGIDLKAYAGQPRVQFIFASFNGHGNDIYLDNLVFRKEALLKPEPNFAVSRNQICQGSNVSFTDQSTNSPTSWVWSFPGGIPASDTTANPVVSYPEAGTYAVILTAVNQAGGASITKESWITVDPEPSLNLVASDSVICAGGEVTLTAQGFDNFAWNFGDGEFIPGGPTVKVQPPRDMTFSVRAEGESGCISEASALVRVEQGQKLEVSPPTQRICQGSSVELVASGAISYVWSPAESLNKSRGSSVLASPTETTTFIVLGRTDAGCEMKKEVIVEVDQAPASVSAQASDLEICPGETVRLTASGGAAYRWYPSFDLNSPEGSEVIASPTATTTYKVEIQTETGCSIEKSLVIQVAAIPEVTASARTQNICKGEPVRLSATGATRYRWSPAEELSSASANRIQALPSLSTLYKVVGMNDAGCKDSATIQINVREAKPVTLTVSDPVICRGQGSVLTASGANKYSWSTRAGALTQRGPRLSVRPREDTEYFVRATDEFGCESEATAMVQVSEGGFPKADFSADKTLTCAGQEIQFRSLSQGAVDYFWEFPNGSPATSREPNPVVTYSKEGIYDVVLTVSGCSRQRDQRTQYGYVVVNEPFRLRLDQRSQSICAGESVEINASGGVNYSWSPAMGLDRTAGSSVIAQPNMTTTYTLTSEDREGCIATEEITLEVVEGTGKLLVEPAVPPVICAGESVTLQAVGGLDVRWTPATGLDADDQATVTARPEVTTTYRVSGTNYSGCKLENTVKVIVHPKNELTATADRPTICSGEQVNLSLDQSGVYNWSPTVGLSTTKGTEITAFPLETTTYTVTGVDANGCHSQASVQVQVDQGAPIRVTAQELELCKGEATLLTASGGSNYVWAPANGLDKTSGPIVTAAPTQTTTYTVSTGGQQCGNEQSITIAVIEPKPLAISPANPQICPGESVNLEVSGGTRYIWDAAEGLSSIGGAQVSVKPTQTTSYTVRSFDPNAFCETKGAVTVVVKETNFLRVSASKATVCPNEEVVLLAEGGAEYRWEEGSGLDDSVYARAYAYPEMGSTFRVVGTDAVGCKDTATLRVDVRPMVANFTVTDSMVDLADGQSLLRFTDETDGAKAWAWNFGQGSTSAEEMPAHVFSEPGKYPVSLIVSNGICTDTVSKTIVVTNTSSLEELQEDGEIEIAEIAQEGKVDLSVDTPRNMFLNLRILDARGTQLLATTLRVQPGEFAQQLDLTAYDKGLYHIQLSDGIDIYTQEVYYP
ncbi:MAG: PKD domain-containing protein [Bacteroidota bacterium]